MKMYWLNREFVFLDLDRPGVLDILHLPPTQIRQSIKLTLRIRKYYHHIKLVFSLQRSDNKHANRTST